MQLWMHSPTHRDIILMKGLRRVGLGVAIGTYRRQPRRRDGDGRLRRLDEARQAASA